MQDGDRATIDDLYRVEGQAELIDGRIVRLPGHGWLVGHISMEIGRSLYDYEDRVGVGEVHTATLGYVVPRLKSGRETFCADVSYYIGPPPENPMAFIEGRPPSRSRSETSRITGPRPRRRWPPSGPTTSRPAR